MLLRISKNIISSILLIFSILAGVSLFNSCANQKPPGGGEEDKIPPKLVFQTPKSNSLNFNGKSLILEFDEYVDKRSLQEAFHISPPYKGEITFEWNGKEVEIIFENTLRITEPNKTFVVTINSTLTDIRGNKLNSPISFAFSTGSKIDMAGISGRVFNNDEKPVTILAYKIGIETAEFDPTKNLADYITETSTDGVYNLTNLAPGQYRVIAIIDEDRNIFYTSERESFGVLPDDIQLEDSVQLKSTNFFLNRIGVSTVTDSDVNTSDFFKDSLGIVFSSVESDSRIVLPSQSIFLFFNKHKPSRVDFVNSFTIKDEGGNPERIVYNWRNDSLIEIISPNKLAYNKEYNITFKINITKDSLYSYFLKFRTVSTNSFGEVNGLIRKPSEVSLENVPVFINLTSQVIKPEIKYSFSESDTVYNLKNIFESEYSLFSFIDKNLNGVYNYGSPYPFEYSEPFFVYPQSISAKGGWAVENVIINFVK
jgi:hypothetical protein